MHSVAGQVRLAGITNLGTPAPDPCLPHGSRRCPRGGCFAGSSPGITTGITTDITPFFSRCRRFGTPENLKPRKPQRLRDSRSSRDIVALGALTESEAADAFATPSASVASGDFAAPAILTDSGSRELHGPTARESFQVPRLPWPPETSRPHASSQNPWASEASQNQALSRLPWLR